MPETEEGITPHIYKLRLPIYLATAHILSSILRTAKADDSELFKFANKTDLALFLFGEDIENYRLEIIKKVLELRKTQSKMNMRQKYDEDEWSKMVNDEIDQIVWFEDQLRECKKIFYPYLKIN